MNRTRIEGSSAASSRVPSSPRSEPGSRWRPRHSSELRRIRRSLSPLGLFASPQALVLLGFVCSCVTAPLSLLLWATVWPALVATAVAMSLVGGLAGYAMAAQRRSMHARWAAIPFEIHGWERTLASAPPEHDPMRRKVVVAVSLDFVDSAPHGIERHIHNFDPAAQWNGRQIVKSVDPRVVKGLWRNRTVDDNARVHQWLSRLLEELLVPLHARASLNAVEVGRS